MKTVIGLCLFVLFGWLLFRFLKGFFEGFGGGK